MILGAWPHQMGPGHIVADSKAAVTVAVDIAVFRRPLNGFGIGASRVHIGESSFHGAGRGGEGQRHAQHQHEGVKAFHRVHKRHPFCLQNQKSELPV